MAAAPADPVDRGRTRAGLVLLTAAVVGSAEAVALLGLAAAELVVAGSERSGVAATSGAFFGVCGLALAWSARGLRRRQPWARGPLVVTQLLLLAVAWTYHQPYPFASTVAAFVAGLELVVLLSPATTRALGHASA